jgi:hypothetical protein
MKTEFDPLPKNLTAFPKRNLENLFTELQHSLTKSGRGVKEEKDRGRKRIKKK